MPAAVPHGFFKERRSFAEIKKEILGRFFAGWCDLQASGAAASEEEALLYVDVHASGTASATHDSPALPADLLENLLQSFGKKPGVREQVRPFLGDASKVVHEQLESSLPNLPGYPEFMHPPVSLHEPVNQAMLLELAALQYPAFLFLNPFSCGTALEFFRQFYTSDAADLLLLVCPDTLVKAFSGRKINPVLSDIFSDRLPLITDFCKKEKNKLRKADFILGHLQHLLQAQEKITQCFTIHEPSAGEPAYYLLFTTPHGKVSDCFKELLLSYTDFHADGVPLFAANYTPPPQLSLFPQRRVYSIGALAEDLAARATHYKYKSVEKICEDHSTGTPYIPENYLAAYELLRDQKKVEMLNAKTLQAIRKPTLASIIKYK